MPGWGHPDSVGELALEQPWLLPAGPDRSDNANRGPACSYAAATPSRPAETPSAAARLRRLDSSCPSWSLLVRAKVLRPGSERSLPRQAASWLWRIRPAASVCRISLRPVNHSMRMRKLPVPAPRGRLRAAVLDRATSMPVHRGFRLAAGSQRSRDGSLNRVLRVANWMQSPARPLDRLRGDCPLHSSHRMCGTADATRDEQS
jgi:hypothetical protein